MAAVVRHGSVSKDIQYSIDHLQVLYLDSSDQNLLILVSTKGLPGTVPNASTRQSLSN